MKKMLIILILLLASTGTYMLLADANQSSPNNAPSTTLSNTNSFSVSMGSLSYSDYKAIANEAIELAFDKHLNF